MNLKKIASLIIIFSAFGFLIFNIYKNWQTVITHSWHLKSSDVMLLLGFLSIVYLVNATSWHLLMRALGINLSYLKNLKIWLYSNTARLIPGIIWQYGSRVVLASSEGINKKLVSSALIIELSFILTTGLICILVGAYFWDLNLYFDLRFLLLLVPILPLLILIVTKIAKIYLPLTWVPVLFLSYLLQFIVDGSVLFYLSRAAVDLSLNLYPVFVSIFALSWLLGYISFFAPAGLGIQEVTMATLLSFYMPFPVASIVAIAFRLVLYVSEGLTLLVITYLNGKRT